MSKRKIEKSVKITIEFDEWEVKELQGIFEADAYSDTARRYRDLFENVLDGVQG